MRYAPSPNRLGADPALPRRRRCLTHSLSLFLSLFVSFSPSLSPSLFVCFSLSLSLLLTFSLSLSLYLSLSLSLLSSLFCLFLSFSLFLFFSLSPLSPLLLLLPLLPLTSYLLPLLLLLLSLSTPIECDSELSDVTNKYVRTDWTVQEEKLPTNPPHHHTHQLLRFLLKKTHSRPPLLAPPFFRSELSVSCVARLRFRQVQHVVWEDSTWLGSLSSIQFIALWLDRIRTHLLLVSMFNSMITCMLPLSICSTILLLALHLH